MKTVKVKVTAKDIKRGVRGEFGGCPVAIAMRRTLGNNSVMVGNESWWSKSTILADLPAAVQLFTSKFDSNRPVKPFKFSIQVP